MPSVFEIVTNRVLTALEQGEIPWHRPWVTVNSGAFNRVTGKKYSLLNQMMLAHGDGEYASYAQWTKLGGSIRIDEKPEIVVFWKWPEEKEDAEEDEQAVKLKRPVLRYYRVYHISQVDGVKPLDRKIRVYNHDLIEQAENLMHGYLTREGIRLENAMTNEAFYSPARDVIHIPAITQYEFVEEYYSTALHEGVHSTGHPSRLNRAGLKNVAFGSETYSMEELVAEIGSAALINHLGIETDHSIRNANAYIQGWLKTLKNDKKMIVFAAGQAEKAVKYMLEKK